MKKTIAKVMAVVFVLSMMVVFSPSTLQVDVVSAATNTAPATTPATTTTKAPAANTTVSAGQTYTVANGDMMWKIAKKFNMTLEQLLKLNPQITNPAQLKVGQKINVAAAAATTASSLKVYQGLGHTVAFRNGPGKDEEGVAVYSFNIVMADVTFDAEGRIINAFIDGYEVSTPNYDGASMPHFTGWPGTVGYNVTDHATAKVTKGAANTVDTATAEVKAWQTKRERGAAYGMNANNDWYKQMDFYQNWFKGKTIPEIKAWFAKNTTAAGRPIKLDTTNADDKAKLAKLTPAEMAEHVDVVTGATMSMSDAHGDFIGALENAYNNRVEVTIQAK